MNMDITLTITPEIIDALKSTGLISKTETETITPEVIEQAVLDNAIRKRLLGFKYCFDCKLSKRFENPKTGYMYNRGSYVTLYTNDFRSFYASAHETIDLFWVYDGEFLNVDEVDDRTKEAAKEIMRAMEKDPTELENFAHRYNFLKRIANKR